MSDNKISIALNELNLFHLAILQKLPAGLEVLFVGEKEGEQNVVNCLFWQPKSELCHSRFEYNFSKF